MKLIFNRYENKYLVTSEQKRLLLNEITKYLPYDNYSKDGSSYYISNIYFDSSDYSIIRNSINKGEYKEKLRMRTYEKNIKEDFLIFFEIKKKFNKVVNKRRVVLSYKDYYDYIYNHNKPKLDFSQNQIFNEIEYMLNTTKAFPRVKINYNRVALKNNDESLRITFDSNIEFEYFNHRYSLLDRDMFLLEVKTGYSYPLWLVRLLQSFDLKIISFSKYKLAYQKIVKEQLKCI